MPTKIRGILPIITLNETTEYKETPQENGATMLSKL